MSIKNIPFYGNHEDDMHCAVAVYRMLFEYFLHRKLTWGEAERISAHTNERAAWTVTIWERMSRMGFDIRMIENFDYRRYREEGDAYLKEYLTPKEYEWQVKHTNIRDIAPYIPAFLKQVRAENRRPTLRDIDDMLDDGRLVFLTLNSQLLNDKEGYVSHAVLILAKSGKDYIMHDPGKPPHPNRRVTKERVWQAMGADSSTSEATGIKLSSKSIRADVLVAGIYPAYSRAALAKLFKEGLVTRDDKPLKPGDKLQPDSDLQVDVSSLQKRVEDIDLPLLYEDDDCVVINKPAGVLTHALGVHGTEASVASFLRSKIAGLNGDRAGIVHRLDRATSGVIIGAKNQKALSWLQKQFSQRKVKKSYVAVVEGMPKQAEAVIDMPIERNPKAPATFRTGVGGKQAKTHYKVLQEGEICALLELTPETGRTHQLRVHLAKVGHPIKGDPLYGTGNYKDRLFLHAHKLEITLPNHERKTFTAPLPKIFKDQIKNG